MSNDSTNRALALTEIDALSRSERGFAALQALHVLLANDATYGLDLVNQRSLEHLLGRALETPSVRELIADAVRPASAADTTPMA